VQVNRVWTALLLIATAVVAASVVYVLSDEPKVSEAGQTPGYSASAGLPGSPTSTSSSPSSSASLGVSSVSTSAAKSHTSSSTTSASTSHVKPVIAFLGDDYTAGIGATETSDGFTELIGKELGATVDSVGSDGAGYATSSASGKTYLQEVPAVVALHPSVVVVTGGRNDYLAGDAPSVPSAALAIFTALHNGLPNALIIAVSSFWGDSPHPAALDTIDAAVQSAIQTAGGQYISLPDPLEGHPEWMFDQADPNDAGYEAIASALGPKLKLLLPTS
jgi:lysophospholipase L1-like esterase